MAVNTMSKEQAYAFVKAVTEQATGEKVLTPTDATSYITVGQKALAAGYDPLLGALSQVIERTLFAVRPYTAKFDKLIVSEELFGAITRKINFGDDDPEANQAYSLVEGESIDMYKVGKNKILELCFVGSDMWNGKKTVYGYQLDTAFKDADEGARFFSALILHFANEREQWLENMKRTVVTNFIAGKIQLETDDAEVTHVVHLLTEYNTATGNSYADIPSLRNAGAEAYADFIRFVYARIERLSDYMTERSRLYQRSIVVDGEPFRLNRHTPKDAQRLYLNADLVESIKTSVRAITYHENLLTLPGFETVNFWQAIDKPMSIDYTGNVIDETGKPKATGNIKSDVVAGVLFDKDAISMTIKHNSLKPTPWNVAGEYMNYFAKTDMRFANDFTEKGIVLLLD